MMDIKITRLVAAPFLNIVLELKLVHLIIHHVFALPLAGSRCIQHRSSSLPALNIDRALSPALVLKSAYFDRCELTTDRFRKKAKHLFLLLLVQSLRILFGSRRPSLCVCMYRHHVCILPLLFVRQNVEFHFYHFTRRSETLFPFELK